MQLTKALLENWQQGKLKENIEPSHPSEKFVHQLMRQGKQLSQLVARSWIGDEIGLTIKNIFIDPRGADGSADGKLKKLLGDNGEGEFGELLLSIFHPYELPIFDHYELTQVYNFFIDWETWEGSLDDIKQPYFNQGKYFNIVIPYPPRPELGEATVTSDQLKAWVAQDVTDPDGNLILDDTHTVFPPYPYIPQTSC